MLRHAGRRTLRGAHCAAALRPHVTAAEAAALELPHAQEAVPPAYGAGTHARQPRWLAELGVVRNDWTRQEVRDVFNAPLLELVFAAARVHRMYHDPRQVQQCTLMSIKTGGCPEDCGYCSQSSKHKAGTGLKATPLADLDAVYAAAVRAKEAGSTRFCMGAAWRGPSQVGAGQFGRVLEMTRRIRGLGLEVCATLGMLTPDQAVQLREAGLTAYNHNLDTSPEHYAKVTSTRKYEDRLATLAAVRDVGISVCCGGILGLGEDQGDRAALLHTLATLPSHPESVPINALVPVPGTPMAGHERVSGLDVARAVAAARVVMPHSVVRLSAGRLHFSAGEQALCFMAGANSVFAGDKLLTTQNNDANEDAALFAALGLTGRPAFVPYAAGGPSSSGEEWAAMSAGGAALDGGGGKACGTAAAREGHGEHSHQHRGCC